MDPFYDHLPRVFISHPHFILFDCLHSGTYLPPSPPPFLPFHYTGGVAGQVSIGSHGGVPRLSLVGGRRCGQRSRCSRSCCCCLSCRPSPSIVVFNLPCTRRRPAPLADFARQFGVRHSPEREQQRRRQWRCCDGIHSNPRGQCGRFVSAVQDPLPGLDQPVGRVGGPEPPAVVVAHPQRSRHQDRRRGEGGRDKGSRWRERKAV